MKHAQKEDPSNDDTYSLDFAKIEDYRMSFDHLLCQVENNQKPMFSALRDIDYTNIFCGLGSNKSSCEFRWIYTIKSVCYYHAWYIES